MRRGSYKRDCEVEIDVIEETKTRGGCIGAIPVLGPRHDDGTREPLDEAQWILGGLSDPMFVYPSPDQAQHYRRELQDAVYAMREGRFPHRDALVWPAGLDRAAIVAGLALPEGRHKLLRHAGLTEGNDPLTAHELLCVPNIGSRAIRELIFAVDEFLSEYVKSFEGRPEPASVAAMRLRMEVENSRPGRC